MVWKKHLKKSEFEHKNWWRKADKVDVTVNRKYVYPSDYYRV